MSGILCFNNCSSGTVLLERYINRNRNITKFEKIIFGRCLVNPIIQYWRCLFFHKYKCFSSFEAEKMDNGSKQFSSTGDNIDIFCVDNNLMV